MVAVIHGEDLTELLDIADLHGRARRLTIPWPRRAWAGTESHLCLLVYEEEVRWLGRAIAGNAITTWDRRIEIVDIEPIPSLPLAEVRAQLPPKVQEYFRTGLLPEGTGVATVAALRALLPEYAPLINRLNAPYRRSRPFGRRGLLLDEQRDATGLVLDISGVRRDVLRDWRPDPQAPSFLAGVEQQRYVSEETLIDHDVARFPGLAEQAGGHVDWRVFGNRNTTVFVMNANMEPLERSTGVDLVYYNETHRSFVLVQYKRMRRESADGGESTLAYRPDKQMVDELARMREVDQVFGTSTDGGFRLSSKPCWVKLCNPSAASEDPRALIKGLYLAREHFEEVVTTAVKGPRGGVRIGYANAGRHVNNTLFTELVRDAWIGTRGTGTDELAQLIAEILASRKAVVFGSGLGPPPPGPTRP